MSDEQEGNELKKITDDTGGTDSSAFATPLAIILAGIMVAGALLYSNVPTRGGTPAVIADVGQKT